MYTYPNGASFDLELQNRTDGRPQGDAVEGRVAGALYDLFDYTNDGFDQTGFGFVSIWWTLSYESQSFREFWQAWKARGYEKHFAVQSIFQNTIDYNTTPTIRQLPNLLVLQNFVWNQAIDLWAYADDPESADSQLVFWILQITDQNCGVTLNADSRYVNIAPRRDWVGSCNVTIRVIDGIRGVENSFTVNVVTARSRTYLPFVSK